jgi:hypothetical protein
VHLIILVVTNLMHNFFYNLLLLYLLTAIVLSPGGSTQLHTTIYRTTNKNTEKNTNSEKKECGRVRAVPRLKMRVIPWHLPYNWGKSTENPQSGMKNFSHYKIHTQVKKNLYLNPLHVSHCMFMYDYPDWGSSVFFLSCKANAKVKPGKTVHGPHAF